MTDDRIWAVVTQESMRQTMTTNLPDPRIAALAESTGQTVEQVEKMFVARQPMGRLGTADEIAAAALYLASDESRFTSGTHVVVDGGWTL
jgi:2-keto-3-deoxy-L-fuconate dehydrogenase